MKKHLFATAIAAVVISIVYTLVAHHYLAGHHFLVRQDDKNFRIASWFLIAVACSCSPLFFCLDLEDLYTKTKGNTAKGVLKGIHYGIHNPIRMRFVLFLVRYPLFLYLFLLIPFVYPYMKAFFRFLLLLSEIFSDIQYWFEEKIENLRFWWITR